MHIAEGVLSPAVLGGGAVLAAVGTAIGLRKLDYDKLMTVGILSATFFVASLVHVPVGFSSAHLLLNALLGVLLGWAAFPAILVALLLQAILFQFGGLTVLGVNTCNVGFAAVFTWYFFRGLCHLWHGSAGLKAAAALSGAVGVLITALLTAISLGLSDEGFVTAAKAIVIAHLPIMAVEALITMFTIAFIAKVRPEMLASVTRK